MKRVVAAVAVLVTALAGRLDAADQLIFIVRHAERAPDAAAAGTTPMMANDPPISEVGRVRAARLAAMIASADVRHLFTTEYARTRQTAAPLAEKLKLELTVLPAKEADALLNQVRKATGNILIVGHSNTVPDILERLGVTDPIAIADGEYDNLFVVVRREAGEPTLIRLRY